MFKLRQSDKSSGLFEEGVVVLQFLVAIDDGYLVAVAEQNQMVLLIADQKLIRRCFAHKSVADLTIRKLPSEEQ